MSKPAASKSKSGSEKTVSTIPKKSRQPAVGPGPPTKSTYERIESLFKLVQPDRKEKPADPEVRGKGTDNFFQQGRRKKLPEDLQSLPSTVRGQKTGQHLNLVSQEVVKVTVRRGKDKTKAKVKAGVQCQPSTVAATSISRPPPPPKKRKNPP